MSDDDKTTDTPEADALFDHGNIVSFPEATESDPALDLLVLVKQRDQLHAQVKDMERALQQKNYELDLNGGLARLNVAGDILTGYAAAGNLPTLKGETRLQAAMRYADELCTDFEERMEKRAADFMAMAPMSPSDEIHNPMTEN
jgi:hypothetical protein